jgi:hypothetical protein
LEERTYSAGEGAGEGAGVGASEGAGEGAGEACTRNVNEMTNKPALLVTIATLSLQKELTWFHLGI